MIRTFLRFLGILGTPLGHPRGNSSISTSILHQPQRYTDLALWRVINFGKESLSLFSLWLYVSQKQMDQFVQKWGKKWVHSSFYFRGVSASNPILVVEKEGTPIWNEFEWDCARCVQGVPHLCSFYYRGFWLMYVQVGDFCISRGLTIVPLTRISCNTVFSKSQNARKAGTLCIENSPQQMCQYKIWFIVVNPKDS